MKFLSFVVMGLLVGCGTTSVNKPAAAPTEAPTSEPNPTGTRCPVFFCGDNGTQLTGIRGDHASTVRSVVLPSGETVELR